MRLGSLTVLLSLFAVSAVACGIDDHADAETGARMYPGEGERRETNGTSGGMNSVGSSSGSSGAAVSKPAAIDGVAQQAEIRENDFISTAAQPTSTFGVDVDTASYTIMRRDLNEGRLPLQSEIRPEELVNYFRYAYPQPEAGKPFSVTVDAAPSKFGDGLHLVRVGLQGRIIDNSNRKPVNLVFLVDTSGSMGAPEKLPLVQYTLKKLTEQLRATDTLAIVTYAGEARTLLEPTTVTDKARILTAIDALRSGGSTNGEGGIKQAYALAEKAKTQDNESRVILCTDGDFNVGLTGDALVNEIVAERDKGVTLTTLGFGSSGYDDAQMESLADKGNGNYAFVDSEAEADRIVGMKLTSTIVTIAKDVKVQLTLSPNFVSRYRLIGYENRVMPNQDFTNDRKDGGEIGAGHTVTAFYEVELTEAGKNAALHQGPDGELAKVDLRYKAPADATSQEFATSLGAAKVAKSFDEAAPDFRFAAGVIELAEILRHSKHSQGARFDDIVAITQGLSNNDKDRMELVTLTESAKTLWR